jgi:hypothetical protein
VFQVYYFPGQVGQGKVSWEDLPKHALLRDKVLSAWPKDKAGRPKKLEPAEEAVFLDGLSEEERSTVAGLGGSQKAEVAWMDKHDNPYDELDVGEFGLKYLGMAAEQAKRNKLRNNFTRKATYSLFGGQVHTDPLLNLCVVSFCGSANKFDFQVSAC